MARMISEKTATHHELWNSLILLNPNQLTLNVYTELVIFDSFIHF